MRRVLFISGGMLAVYAIMAGCDLFGPPIVPPDGNGIIWGLDRSDPYFGRLRAAANPEEELGDIILALCGCGSWRAVIATDEDSEESQVTLFFSADHPARTRDVLTVSGETEDITLSGVIDQVAGVGEGEVNKLDNQMVFTVEREQEQIDKVGTCVLCHIGENSVWPLPDTHQVVELDPPSCLECHELD